MSLPAAPRVKARLRRLVMAAAWATLAALGILTVVLAFSLSVDRSGEATREVLFNVGHWLRWFLYASTAVLFVVIALGPLRRSELWRIGGPEPRWDRVGVRLRVFLFYGIGQGRLPNDL